MSEAIKIIKDELERINEARAKATQGKWQISEESFFEVWTFPETNLIAKLSPKDDFSFGKTSCYNNSEFIALAANEITNLTKALSVAVTKLKEISMESSTTECSHDDLVKLENRVTKKAHFAIKQIANILSGGKDGE
jgi:hypothetical protein